jgi:hypothetical protein
MAMAMPMDKANETFVPVPEVAPCFVPTSLFPITTCVQVRLNVQCFGQSKAWDEECVMCTLGKSFTSMEECVQSRNNPKNVTSNHRSTEGGKQG